jgi:type IV pilus assembly protein PilA
MEPLSKCRAAATLIILVVVVAIPNLGSCDRHMRQMANEMAVVVELRFINAMQVRYRAQFGRFAITLAELGPASSGIPGSQAADLIPSALASGNKDGYFFSMTATPSGYMIHANPKAFGRSGYRTFYTDQNGIIRQNWSAEPANVSSPPLP